MAKKEKKLAISYQDKNKDKRTLPTYTEKKQATQKANKPNNTVTKQQNNVQTNDARTQKTTIKRTTQNNTNNVVETRPNTVKPSLGNNDVRTQKLDFQNKNEEKKFTPQQKEITKRVDKSTIDNKYDEVNKLLDQEAKDKANITALKRQKYEKARSKALKEEGIDARTKFDNLQEKTIDYSTKKEDATHKLKPVDYSKVEEKTKNERNELNAALNDERYVQYVKDEVKAQTEPVTLADKTIGVPVRATQDLFSTALSGEKYTDPNTGQQFFLPSYSDSKQDVVSNSYNTGIGRFIGDTVYNTTKIGEAALIDAFTFGMGGKALYWSDMAVDNYKNAINRGYSREQALANTAVSTGTEFLTEKFLGGLSKKLTGGKASEVKNLFSNLANKIVKDPKIADIIGSMGSEGLEEFVQEYIDQLNELATLKNSTDFFEYLKVFADPDVFKSALYSGAVGMGSGGAMTGAETALGLNTDGRQAERNIEKNNQLKATLEEKLNKTKDKELKKQYQDVINAIDEYNKRPFGNTTKGINNNLLELNLKENEVGLINNMLENGTATEDEVVQMLREYAQIKQNNPDAELVNTEEEQQRLQDQAQQVANVREQVQNKKLTYEQGKQALQEIQEGTFRQNMMYENIAQREFDKIQRDLKNGKITEADATNMIQALAQTLEQQKGMSNNEVVENGNISNNNDNIIPDTNEVREVNTIQKQQSEASQPQESTKEEKTAEKKLEEKNKIKEEVKALSAKVNDFVEKNQIGDGGLSKENRAKYEKMNKKISDLRYELETKHYKEISENNIKDDRKTSLEKSVYVQARKDTLKNKDIYDALSRASWGVGFNEDTAVDDILNGKNKNVTPQQLYEAFDKTRDELRKAYGDKITLYRVEGKQKQKATKNYGSSIEYTKQYGDDVKKYDIDIKDIVAINTNRTGKYEDIIVATGGIEKYLGNIKQNVKADITNEVIKTAYKDIKDKNVKATIAPYYNTPLTKQNYSKIKNAVDESFKSTANNIATLIGGNIKETTNNIGGFTFDEGETAGSWVRELSYTFELENMSKDDAILFTSLMGDLGHEQQEAVIAATYEEDINKANAIEFRLSYKNREKLSEALDDLGIHDYTIDTQNKTLKLLEFEDLNNPVQTAKKIADVIEKIGGNLEDAEYSGVQSDYITKGTREGTYKSWLEANKGSKENRELYSLVKQAYEKVKGSTEGEEGTSDSSFSNEEKPITMKDAVEAFNRAKRFGTEVQNKAVQTFDKAMGENNPLTKKQMDKIRHDVHTNKATVEKAKSNLSGLTFEQKYERATQKLNSNKVINEVDVAEVIDTLVETVERGTPEQVLNLLQDYSIMETEAGRVVQAASLLRKMSPVGQLAMLNKIVARQQKLGNKKWAGVKLNQDLVQKVLDTYENKEQTKWNQAEMEEAVDELKQDIANQLKMTISDKVNAWRYLSMLGNPKTHIRNVVANTVMSVVKGGADKLSGGLQDVFIKDGKYRLTGKEAVKTRTAKSSTKEVKQFSKLAFEEMKPKLSGNKYDNATGIEAMRSPFDSKVLKKLDELNSGLLNIEDLKAKETNFKKSFANFLTAQGIKTNEDINNNPDIIDAAKNFALQEANIATFNQDNKLATYLNKLDNLGPVAKVLRGAIIPFTRTPLNIAKTGIEYTPVLGTLTTLNDLKKVDSSMKGVVLINGLSKQTVGAGLLVMGYMLAKSGVLTADSGDDKDDKFEKDQGAKMDFSLKLPASIVGEGASKVSLDLSWLSPSSMPLLVGAAMHEQFSKHEGINEDMIIESLAGVLDPLSEMSCISSFTDVLDSYSKTSAGKFMGIAKSTSQNYISQFIPTVSGQIAKVFDTNKRSTYADKSSSHQFSQETLRKLMFKIPGLRNMLPEQTDYLGDNKKEINNMAIRALDAFFNPMNHKVDTMSRESKELIRLYDKTGNDAVLPSNPNAYINYNDTQYTMTQKEFNKYKRDFGEAAKKNIKEVMDSDEYKSASDDEKADMIEGVMKYSKDVAKDNFLTSKGENYVKVNEDGEETHYESDNVNEITQATNYSIADYYITKTITPNLLEGNLETKKKRLGMVREFGFDAKTYNQYLEEIGNIEADKTASGKSINGTRKRKIIEYLNSLDLTPLQRAMLLKQTYKSYRSYDGEIINAIRNSNLSDEDRNMYGQWFNLK